MDVEVGGDLAVALFKKAKSALVWRARMSVITITEDSSTDLPSRT